MSLMFFNPRNDRGHSKKKRWSNQDIADFYRAVDILKQAGLNTDVDSGVTDEGDPWFVFLRPENGDVIAHFAQIDGRFIAVSALNQEVYSGRDIRGIVDQLLDRHPTLLPQSKTGGRLFLHPTAALSAFLAAAFILTIDGVKAANLNEIMTGVRSEKIATTNNDVGSIDHDLKSGVLKGLFSDLSLSNYNVAILGAALIVELSQNEFDLPSHPDTYESVAGLNVEKTDSAKDDGNKISISSQTGRNLDYSGEASYFIAADEFAANESVNGQSSSEQNSLVVQKNRDELALDFTGNEETAENVSNLVKNYNLFWSNEDLVYQIEYPGDYEPNNQKAIDTNGQFKATEQGAFDLEGADLDIGLVALMESLQGVFQISPSSLGSGSVLSPNNLGVALNDAGELELVSLQSLNFNDDITLIDNTLPPIFEEAMPIADAIIIEEIADPNRLEPRQSMEHEGEVQVSAPLFDLPPILGHSINVPDANLELTKAIDVVFYKGGDAKITEFELGKDLLWFFLSPEELRSADNSINSDGDLLLDFGETGTLTFVGVVSQPSIDLMV